MYRGAAFFFRFQGREQNKCLTEKESHKKSHSRHTDHSNNFNTTFLIEIHKLYCLHLDIHHEEDLQLKRYM